MKRTGDNDQGLWEGRSVFIIYHSHSNSLTHGSIILLDPNGLTIPALRQALSTFGVRFDPTERRSLLFQRYVKLARVESPQSVERWTGQDSLGA